MPKALLTYLAQRADGATFLLPVDLARTIEELFPRAEQLLPSPYKIFPSDETHPPVFGFPLAETAVMKELDARLDRWISDEVAFQLARETDARERAQLSFSTYMQQLFKVAENALMSNLLNDYHAVFWLAHSIDLARHFSSVPRRVSALDTQTGRTQGDALKYRVFAKWAAETREQMSQLASRATAILDGEEQRAVQFIRLLLDDVLLLTEEFIGPDLRELRSYINGYLRRDFQSFRDSFERMRTTATELLQRDRTFRSALTLLGANPEQGITLALLLDSRFQAFFFDHTAVQNVVTREDREQFALIARRVREFAVLNQLRRGIVWLSTLPDGRIVSADRRNSTLYSRSTRPLDYGRPGVLDPMVHRFGLIYDISAFSETLGNIRRGGGKEEIKSYRQMLVFQRRLEAIALRNVMQFEKFLGDGAFYTTRRAMRLVRAAVEIQRFYSEMKRKGFAFNKGLRIAVNYGYYRLLPMKGLGDNEERITEFYGPGIVELSRLTTGKANKEIDEIAAFLVSQGFEQAKVQQFFAPLSRGVDVIDHTQHAREFYAYINASGHLANEGIVASMAFLQELSGELAHEALQIYRLKSSWGTYIGFAPGVSGIEYVGIRLLGMVALKGLDQIEVGEITPFAPGEAEATPLDPNESFVMLLRQELHQEADGATPMLRPDTTAEKIVESGIVICIPAPDASAFEEVLIGEWDPVSDDVRRPLRMPRSDFQRLFSLKGEVTTDLLAARRGVVRELYHRLADRTESSNDSVQLSPFRLDDLYDAYLIADTVVEKL